MAYITDEQQKLMSQKNLRKKVAKKRKSNLESAEQDAINPSNYIYGKRIDNLSTALDL